MEKAVTHKSGTFGLKVLSLLLAILLSLFLGARRDGEISVRVPLKIQNLPPGMVLIQPPPAFLDLRLFGPRLQLRQISPEGYGVSLDCSTLPAGAVVFSGFEQRLQLPAGVQLSRLSPASVTLILARDGRGTAASAP